MTFGYCLCERRRRLTIPTNSLSFYSPPTVFFFLSLLPPTASPCRLQHPQLYPIYQSLFYMFIVYHRPFLLSFSFFRFLSYFSSSFFHTFFFCPLISFFLLSFLFLPYFFVVSSLLHFFFLISSLVLFSLHPIFSFSFLHPFHQKHPLNTSTPGPSLCSLLSPRFLFLFFIFLFLISSLVLFSLYPIFSFSFLFFHSTNHTH